MPSMKRPPLIWSTEAACLATITALRAGASSTLVRNPIRLVAAAAAAMAVSDSKPGYTIRSMDVSASNPASSARRAQASSSSPPVPLVVTGSPMPILMSVPPPCQYFPHVSPSLMSVPTSRRSSCDDPGGRYGCPLARTGFALLARKSNTRIPRLACRERRSHGLRPTCSQVEHPHPPPGFRERRMNVTGRRRPACSVRRSTPVRPSATRRSGRHRPDRRSRPPGPS